MGVVPQRKQHYTFDIMLDDNVVNVSSSSVVLLGRTLPLTGVASSLLPFLDRAFPLGKPFP